MSKRHNSIEALEGRRLLSGNFPVAAGGAGDDGSTSVAVDRGGNIYVAGTEGGVGEVSRYSSDGTLVFTRQFGNAKPYKVGTDDAGNVYLAGTFPGTVDFDPRGGVHNVSSAGGADAFVVKLSAKGNLLGVKKFGGDGDDVATALAVANDGSFDVGGTFQQRANFNPDGTFKISSSGGADGFISEFDSGMVFQRAGSFGGPLDEQINDMALDGVGNIVATGRYQGTVDFDPSSATMSHNIAVAYEAFTLKLTTTGDYVFSAGYGGSGNVAYGTGVTADRAGNVYTVGNFQHTGDFDPGNSTFNLTAADAGSVFITKLDPAGTFIYAKAIGGTDSLKGAPAEISVDKDQNVYTTGRFSGTQDFDPGAGTQNLVSDGADDVFVSKLDSTGAFVFAKSIGGTGNAFATGSTLDRDGNNIVTGVFDGGISFAMSGGGTVGKVSAGGTDLFLTKLDPNGVMD
jgi:hypothetical protein